MDRAILGKESYAFLSQVRNAAVRLCGGTNQRAPMIVSGAKIRSDRETDMTKSWYGDLPQYYQRQIKAMGLDEAGMTRTRATRKPMCP